MWLIFGSKVTMLVDDEEPLLNVWLTEILNLVRPCSLMEQEEPTTLLGGAGEESSPTLAAPPAGSP